MNSKGNPRLRKLAGRAPGRRRFLAGAVSAGVHLTVFAALFWLQIAPRREEIEPSLSPTVLSVAILPKPPGLADAQEAETGGPQILLPPLPHVSVPSIAVIPASSTADMLSDSQLAGAARAGEGASGGGCDLGRAVQQMLRRDPLVRAAVAAAGRQGKATLLWNGDWVRSGNQEGKGLAAVRQAILWEVGFAAESCRNAPMRGMVLLSLDDGKANGATRFAIGAGAWRWSDLLGLHATTSRR